MYFHILRQKTNIDKEKLVSVTLTKDLIWVYNIKKTQKQLDNDNLA